jgi:ribosomal protein S27E
MAALNPANYFPAAPADFNSIVCEHEAVYTPRQAEESILYGVVAENLETFLARQEQRERTVPKFVEREFRSFLDYGIPAHGFLRVHCDECGWDRVVPFSCKGRGFCESCGARRMADTAAHLVRQKLSFVLQAASGALALGAASSLYFYDRSSVQLSAGKFRKFG